MEIEKVYLGLPKYLKDKVLWVSRNYRTNPLSHEPGGADVVVEYSNGQAYGYDWIKKPSFYVQTIWDRGFSEEHTGYESWDDDEKMDLIREVVKCIFARTYTKGNYNEVPFEKVWDSETSDEFPWDLLKKYDFVDTPKYK
jgi:hypothetical protein